MKRIAVALALLSVSGTLAAVPVPKPADLVTATAALTASSGTGRGVLRIEARLAEGWHVNSHKPSEDYLIPTSVALDPSPDVTAGEARYPEGRLVKFAFSETPLSVYEERFAVEVPVSWTGQTTPTLSGRLAFQACNDKQCLAPASVAFQSGAAGPSPGQALSGGAVRLADAPKSREATAAAGASHDFGALLENRGLIFVLPLLFLVGLALNATPCVLPVIPLTIAFFVNQAPDRRRRPVQKTFWSRSPVALGHHRDFARARCSRALDVRFVRQSTSERPAPEG